MMTFCKLRSFIRVRKWDEVRNASPRHKPMIIKVSEPPHTRHARFENTKMTVARASVTQA